MAPVAIPSIGQPAPLRALTYSAPLPVRSRSLSAAHLLVLGIIGVSLAVTGVAIYIAWQRNQPAVGALAPVPPQVAHQGPITPAASVDLPRPKRDPPPQTVPNQRTKPTEPLLEHRPATPLPQPAPMPAPPPISRSTPPQVKRADVVALANALKSARQALGEQDFPRATAQITKAESLAKLPSHQDAVARLKEVSGYVEYFRSAIATALGEMQAGESFTVGTSTEVAFVEMSKNVELSKNTVTLHVGGMNRTYDLVELPVGLAMAIADLKLADSNPVTRVVKGSYLLVHKRADAELIEKAKSWWHEAQARGLDMTHLLPFLTDDYDALVKDVPGEN